MTGIRAVLGNGTLSDSPGEKVTVVQTPKEAKEQVVETSRVGAGGESIPGGGSSKCKGPETGMSPAGNLLLTKYKH